MQHYYKGINFILKNNGSKSVVQLNGTNVKALVDTGIDVTIIKESALAKMKVIKRERSSNKF